MRIRFSPAILVIMAFGLGVASIAAGADPSLVAWWRLDDGAGTTAIDRSGNEHHGALNGTPQWTEGLFGGALDFEFANTQECVVAPGFDVIGGGITLSAWVKPESFSQADARIIDKGVEVAAANDAWWMLSTVASGSNIVLRFRLKTNENATTTTQAATSGNVAVGEWSHTAAIWDGTSMILYKDGAEVGRVAKGGTAVATNPDARVHIGNQLAGVGRRPWDGLIDDVRVYSRDLTVEDLQAVIEGAGTETQLAADPQPLVNAVDVPFDTALSWTPGEFAATHDVYLGTTLAEVTDADRANSMGVLVSQDRTDAEYEPAGLEYGLTYFWRVDEVNAAPDSTVFKGEVWSFTVEPYAYAIAGVTATASSEQVDMPAVNVVNGSGLNDMDQHAIDSETMWLTAADGPAWIQFEFDKAYKLHEMWVWNSNQLIESFLGFGARNVIIEYSTDGQDWTRLDGVPEFARATGAPTYGANTTVSFDGVLAQHVRVTIEANWGGVAPQTGLSEVRFFAVPVQAREPVPPVGATDISVDAELDWRPGREATSHGVYLSRDEQAVADGAAPSETTTGHGYTPTALEFGTTYFWRVNEVGDADTYAGEVWSFTTQQYAAIDDFESYNDSDRRIYDAWIDGYATQTSGSTVGYLEAPFAERTIVHGGAQSMPLSYDNAASPYYSEAELTLDSPQDWTVHGADTLSLHFRGITPSFVETASGNVLMNAIGTDIWGTADEFRFVYKSLTGNGSMVARVESVFNSNAWAKAGVMIRQGIEPGSTHAFMALTPGGGSAGNGASFQRRLTTNGASTNTDSPTLVGPPYWVKIERVGDAFSAYISPDGLTWTQLGTAQNIAMTDPVLIGLALCSHDTTVATGAEFSDLGASGAVSGAWQVTEIGVAQPEGNSPEHLYVTVTDSSGRTKTAIHPDAAATARMGWQQWEIPLSEFSSSGVRLNAATALTVGVGNRTTPAVGGAGIMFIDDIGFGRALP